MKYSYYQVEDFALDPLFQQWIYHPDEKTHTFWKSFLRKHPEKIQDIEQAKQVLLAFHFTNDIISESEISKIRSSIHHRISEEETAIPLSSNYKIPSYSFQNRWQKVAAIVSGFLIVSLICWWIVRHPQVEYMTAYGQTKTITLPDSSTVVLNANSRLWLSGAWDKQSDRIVSLEGEAFFKVKKKPGAGNRKFVVQTKNADIEVLGTRFNVNNRREQTQVVLSSGEVRLKSNLTPDKEVVMKPGELAAISKKNPEIIQQKVNPATYTSWIEKKLVIDNTSIQSIAQLIEDNYGYHVSIESDQLARRKFSATATVPLDDVGMLLKMIEKSFDAEVIKHGKQITIQEKK